MGLRRGGIGIGTIGVMRAFSKGAPVRIFGGSFTGMGDISWYVKADSPIRRLADATEKTPGGVNSKRAVRELVALSH